MNEILLRRKNKLFISEQKYEIDANFVINLISNVQTLGYTFSDKLINIMLHMDKQSLISLYDIVIKTIKHMIGDDVEYKPLYNDFPNTIYDVINENDKNNISLTINNIREFIPVTDVKLQTIDLATKQDFHNIFINMMSSNIALSEIDKKDLIYYLNNFNYQLPDKIPFKETMVFVINNIKNNIRIEELKNMFKTATDVLRLAAILSNDDIERPRFKHFSRYERKLLLELLENCNNIKEDMKRNKNIWQRLGEILHPGEFKKFTKVNDAFYAIRNNVKIESYNGKVDIALFEKDIDTAIKLLSNRPGEFARKIDLLLREFPDNSMQILNAFKLVADKVSTRVLLQVRQHFMNRNNYNLERLTKIQNYIYIYEDNRKPIDEKFCQFMIKICNIGLINQYSKKDFLGKVYVSEEFKNYTVPLSMRNTNQSLKTIGKGSRLKLDNDTNFIRPFIYWKNEIRNGKDISTDIDLSVAFLDQIFNKIDYVDFTHLNNDYSKHSGDITNAPNGASEFIDIDINKALQNGIKYAIINVLSYSLNNFDNLPICYMGYMEKDFNTIGKIYEPTQVKQKINIMNNDCRTIPMILDLENREIVWCDISGNVSKYGPNSINNNMDSIVNETKHLINTTYNNLYDLIQLHITARGIESTKEEADIIFDIDDGITPFDIDEIYGNYI